MGAVLTSKIRRLQECRRCILHSSSATTVVYVYTSRCQILLIPSHAVKSCHWH